MKEQRKKKYKEFKRVKEKLREMLPRSMSICRLDTVMLVTAATKYCSALQQELETLQWEYYLAEKRNMKLRQTLSSLERDDSCWPYYINVTCDTIKIDKVVDTFVYSSLNIEITSNSPVCEGAFVGNESVESEELTCLMLSK